MTKPSDARSRPARRRPPRRPQAEVAAPDPDSPLFERFNEHTYERLGFDRILEAVEERCLSTGGRERLAGLEPLSNQGELLPELQRVAELREALLNDDPFPLRRQFAEVRGALNDVAVPGQYLGVERLFDLLDWLRTAYDLERYLTSRREKYPALFGLIEGHPFPKELIGQIDRVLDARGNLRDDASPELSRIRNDQRSAGSELRSTLTRILRMAQSNNWSEAGEVTIRNNRLVIPVKAEAQGRVQGFVQDVSSSGNTVFIEPTQSLKLNNRIRELELRERNEIIHILQEIAQNLHAARPALLHFARRIDHLDLIQAKARLAVDTKSSLPKVQPQGERLAIREAYFPLLVLRAREEEMTVVPLDLELSPEQRIVVISGPNAGGKSVAMKTIGLLQLMLQSGMLVPCHPDSEFPLFDHLFVDIGDEQSVESDLSTYTSRLAQLRLMGDFMTNRSLFLIDEFGSGTDPLQGGAIAESFLERFVRQGAYGVITTHYGNIKDYAETTEGVGNAAMHFDTQALEPTFKLIEGLPGRSYAFEIARRVGVHPVILRNAKRKMGKEALSVEDMLAELESKQQEFDRLVSENSRRERELDRLTSKNKNLEKELDRKRKTVLYEAKREARKLIEEANSRIEQTIREIRESQAEKDKTRLLRRELAESKPAADPPPPPPEPKPEEKKAAHRVLAGTPEVGDWVQLKNSESIGQVIELQGKKVQVEMGALRATVKINQLQRIAAPPKPKKRQPGDRPARTYSTSAFAAKSELDVMGMRVEGALLEVERLIDEALLAGLPYVRILHGKGSGALREGIRNFLADISAVRSYHDAPIEMGGAGWTIVNLQD